ncbi:RNA-directed DNA polymerase, eukaryota [Tanacetum coccineum]
MGKLSLWEIFNEVRSKEERHADVLMLIVACLSSNSLLFRVSVSRDNKWANPGDYNKRSQLWHSLQDLEKLESIETRKKDLERMVSKRKIKSETRLGLWVLINPRAQTDLPSVTIEEYWKMFRSPDEVMRGVLLFTTLLQSKRPYDSVRWDYLDDVLNLFGFGAKWRSWIQNCLHSSRGSVLVNGSPTSEFQFHKGLKQGDPLSPFLFILIMESLHLSRFKE